MTFKKPFGASFVVHELKEVTAYTKA